MMDSDWINGYVGKTYRVLHKEIGNNMCYCVIPIIDKEHTLISIRQHDKNTGLHIEDFYFVYDKPYSHLHLEEILIRVSKELLLNEL